MSSPELQGISGIAVAKRCALLTSPAQRELLWFLQGLSLVQGDLNMLASDLLKMFPGRIGTDTMRRLGMAKDKCYSAQEAATIQAEIDGTIESKLLARAIDEMWRPADECDDEWKSEKEADRLASQTAPEPWQNLFAKCQEEARRHLSEFFTRLCINPEIRCHPPGEPGNDDQWRANVPYFKDIVEALFEYKRRYEQRVRADFCHTAISREIWEQLDYALQTKRMIVLQGREGRGKTEAVRAWCNCHLGVARFMSLKGRSTMTEHFREFARALGVGHARSHTISHMAANIEEVLQTSHLMPVIDESHFAFSQGPRMRTRPEMLDWIDTALCNPPLPVALVTTPHFMDCVERAVHQVGWNYLQFKRRCKRYRVLPERNTPEDIEAVARHLLPGVGAATIKAVLGYTGRWQPNTISASGTGAD